MATTTRTRSTSTSRAAKSGNPAKRATASEPRGPSAAALRRLKISPEVAAYMEARGIPLPDCPPKVKTPEPRAVRGAQFSFDHVDRVLRAFTALRHVAGQWAGKPLTPDPWQVAYIIAPTFGWVRWDDDAGDYVRIIRDLYVDVPRKNGKSTLSAGLAIYLACADGEAGAQVVTAATSERQAGFVFNPIKTLAERTPALKGKVKAFAKRVVHVRSGSYIEVVSSSADAQHGANIHGGIIDELHVHKTPDLVETIETGRGSRTQPLVVIITTADSGKPDTIYDRKRRYVEQLARAVIKDESVYGVVWAADEGDDPHAETTWRKANPGYGISPTRAYLAAESRKAKNSPADLAAFLRLHLGIRTKQETRYIDLAVWDANAGMTVREDELVGRACYSGLDLASVSDLSAMCHLFPADGGGFDAVWRFWTPEANVEALDKRTAGAASRWVKEGWLTVTPGNVTDYDFIESQALADTEKFDIRSFGFDPYGATQLVNNLAGKGLPMVKVRQGFLTLSPALKECQRLLLLGSQKDAARPMLRHGGNPVMRWMTDNLAVETDATENVKPSKQRGGTSGNKIDGWSALVTAMSEAIADDAGMSAYDDHDLIIA